MRLHPSYSDSAPTVPCSSLSHHVAALADLKPSGGKGGDGMVWTDDGRYIIKEAGSHPHSRPQPLVAPLGSS